VRLVRLPSTPAVVVRIRDPGGVVVAIPDRIETEQLRTLASAVLSPAEYDELHYVLGLSPDTAPQQPYTPPYPGN
jgi:hypothetical protein